MFVDHVQIYVKAGDGGDGLAAYRREKYEPKGGPAGGDGGDGGDVIFKVDEGLNTLMKFRYNRHFKADRGEDGKSKNQYGKNADPLIIPVPPGTTIFDAETNEVIADLTRHDQQAIIARGGRGGRGNTRFASPRNPAPEMSENGEPGIEATLKVELKLIADVGIIGFPSVGKSTLLSVASAAKPKIGDYHFTTLAPNIGVVETADNRNFAMADLPGLIEGAHSGVGLGQQFLRHVERTRILVHVIDMAKTEWRDPFTDYTTVNDELEKYDPALLELPQLITANKMEIAGAWDNLEEFRHKLPAGIPVYPISAYTQEGVQELLYAIADKLDELGPREAAEESTGGKVVYRFEEKEAPFTIGRDYDGAFVISGTEVEKLFKMTDFTQDESTQRFSRQLRGMGVDEALRKKGAKDGDTVRLLDFEFEFLE